MPLCARRWRPPSKAPRLRCSSARRRKSAAAIRIHRRRLSHGASRRAGHQTRRAGPERRRHRAHRFRRIFRGGLSRRSRPHHPVLHRSRSRRDAGPQQHRHRALADGPRREVSAELRAAGLQPRRPLQVLRRRGDLCQWRRRRPGRIRIQGRGQARHRRCATARAPRLSCAARAASKAFACWSTASRKQIGARAVVLACGGFESNREWRARYLGPGWDMAKVRGTRYNTGDGIRMALDIGAQSYGQWSGAHAVAWERYANDYGDVDGQHSAGYRHSYPFGMMVNADGERFVDEGADFRNYTYAKYGRAVLAQPGSYAWQVFDCPGAAAAARRIQDARRDQGARRYAGRTGQQDAGRQSRRLPQDHPGLQRRGEARREVRSQHQGRQVHGRARAQQEQLGEHHGEAAVRGLFGRLRHHLHLRRPEDRYRRPRARYRGHADCRASTLRANSSADCSTSTIRAAPG